MTFNAPNHCWLIINELHPCLPSRVILASLPCYEIHPPPTFRGLPPPHPTMSDTSSLSSSGLSSPPSTDDELQKPTAKTLSLKKGKLFAAPPSRKKKNEPVPSSPESEPAQHTRELSPPHEYVLADNPHIAVRSMDSQSRQKERVVSLLVLSTMLARC